MKKFIAVVFFCALVGAAECKAIAWPTTPAYFVAENRRIELEHQNPAKSDDGFAGDLMSVLVFALFLGMMGAGTGKAR